MMLLLVEVYARPGQAANHRTPKGLAVSVRPWDHQLRQAILLASPYSVVARAPVEASWIRSVTMSWCQQHSIQNLHHFVCLQ
jgi:hypothetical protein